MINMELLSYSNILNAVRHEISPRAYNELLDEIMALPHTLSNNGLLAHVLLSMDDDSADYLFTRLESMSAYFEGVQDYQLGLTA